MRLTAIMLLFKEQAFIEASIRAIYPLVDSICCASQYDRNLAGQEVTPDNSLNVLLRIPDPDNKIKVTVTRDIRHLPGTDSAAKLRNAAIALDPLSDYYLIIDSDEIWPLDVLTACRQEVQKTQWAAYRISSYAYFKRWNYRIVEPGHGYRPLVFVRKGFHFHTDRQIDWKGPARWKEYLRKGRKPKTVYFPPHLRLHHGSCVGDDTRILNKLKNYSHADLIDPTWFDRVWKNFHPGIRNIHYYPNQGHLYESLVTIPTADLPEEVRRCSWPEGWIER
jgi:hypothetical protein